MRKAEINGLEISDLEPRLVANVESVEKAKKAADYADIIEVRCDLISENDKVPNAGDIEKTVKAIRENTKKPLLATIRKAQDGGEWYKFMGSEEDRLDIFRKIYGFVDSVDIEFNSNIRGEVIKDARERNLGIILSYHNFVKTEEKPEIQEKIRQMDEVDADILKVACYANTGEDTVNLFKILLDYYHNPQNHKPLAMIGMGREGTYTRVAFPAMGSCLTYGYVGNGGEEKAPGQLPIQLLRQMMDKYLKYMPVRKPGTIKTVFRKMDADLCAYASSAW